MEKQFIDMEDWCSLNGIVFDEESNRVRCVNMPDDWYDEEEELEDEEE